VPELLLACTQADFDARDLVRAIERQDVGGLTVTAAPGLLAPGRSGTGTVRDGARARGATVVVVAPGGPDLANHALLTVEAARAVGLPVAAVVVAGVSGTAIGDQRAALRAQAGADVVDLPDPRAPSAAVAGWPIAEWLAAEPTSAGKTAEVPLAPYAPWEPRVVPDPRSAGRGVIDPVLLEIVAAEGPVLASRAYALYNKAAGGKKLTSIARAPLSGAAYRLRIQGRIEIVGPEEARDDDEVLHLAGSPPVRVRELGPRPLDEVPLLEVAELMRRLRAAGAQELRRAVLDRYGLVRMTAKADEQLARAEEIVASDRTT
jgi:hypothetical protein